MRAITIKFSAAVLLLAAFSSQALTLGRMRGAALVGQGLDIAVQVQMDPEDTPASLCFEADVFHADTRQDPRRVQVTVETAPASQLVNVRVVSSAPVDEPVVTVYLRAGCTQKTSRRYVLLADIATEQAAPVAVRALPVPMINMPSEPAPAEAATVSVAAPAGGSAAAGPPERAATVATARRPVAPRKARPATKAPAPAARVRKAAPPKIAVPPTASSRQPKENLSAPGSAGQPRLKLDPQEVLSERVATLESSAAEAPSGLAAREALEAQRLQSLENSVKTLLALAAKNEASLLEVRTQLQRAESERYRNPLVVGLIALLLACLAGIAFLLSRRDESRRRRSGNWWGGSPSVPPTAVPAETAPAFGRPSGFTPVSAPSPLATPDSLRDIREQTQRAGPRSVPAPITQVDVNLVEMSESSFDSLMQSGASHSAIRKPLSAEPAGYPLALGRRKAINSEELFDIRQQADFFVSLGQTDQAVRILENRISESGESSPLAYLDLLKIFHSLGLKADFRQVREDFNLLFNARVSEFDNFNDEGSDLQEYPDVLGRVTEEWGTPSIFATIEAGLFRDQDSSQRKRLDLAAFRDLLLLHAIAQWAASASDSLPGPLVSGVAAETAGRYSGSPSYTDTQSTGRSGAADEAYPGAPFPKIDGVSELDIDLSDLVVIPPPEPGVPRFSAETDAPLAAIQGADNNLMDFDLGGVEFEHPPSARR